MGLNAKHLRELVVAPVLQATGLHSPAAEDLVMGTAAVESHLKYLAQIRGPALGLFQVEPATYTDYVRYLNLHPELITVAVNACGLPVRRAKKRGPLTLPDVDTVVYNLRFAAFCCRVHYLRIPEALPDAGDVHGYAAYWKKYYNTVHGAGTVQKFVDAYRLVQ